MWYYELGRIKERKSVLQKLRILYHKRSQRHKNTDISSEARAWFA